MVPRVLMCSLCLALPLAAQERPLPDPAAFLREVRARLQTDDQRQRDYVFVETRREQKLDKQGRPTSESVSLFESYPGLPGEHRWERAIVKDGKPVPAAELEKQDRERQKKAAEYLRKKAAQTPRDREKQAREYEKARQEHAEAIDEMFSVYDVRMLERETIDGHDTIRFSLTPRPNVRPRTRDGRIMQHFIVQAWVSESDYELVRVEAEAIRTVSIGLGLLARVHKGTRAMFERRKVNGEVWLPASFRYTASARVGLVKMLRRGGLSEFSDYKKFTVDTSATYTQK